MSTRAVVIGIILACTAAAVLLVAACAGLFVSAFRNIGKADGAISSKVDALFAAIDKGTFGDLYATATTPEFREKVSRKEWDQIGLAVKTHLGRLKAKTVARSNFQQFNADQYADAVYSATFEKGTGEIRTRFTGSGGDWRLLVFHVDSPQFLQDLSTRVCPHCGEACPASAKFCPHCGKPLPAEGNGKIVPKKAGHHRKDTTAKEAKGVGE